MIKKKIQSIVGLFLNKMVQTWLVELIFGSAANIFYDVDKCM